MGANSEKTPRIPIAVDGIQVNFCKNPLCLNYGRPADPAEQPRGPGAATRGRDTYTLTGGSGSTGNRDRTRLVCSLCDESLPIKSNVAIHEELERLTAYLQPVMEPSCPSQDCPNHLVGISIPKTYYFFGKTKSGSQRYRCRLCNITFAIGSTPTIRQRRPEVNETVFRLLVNKMPLKRICEAADINIETLYRKINFIHRQCLVFAAKHEKQLPGLSISRLYISVDRQDHVVNWKKANDKRNITLSALGSADNKTGFVFGIHVNYDPNQDSTETNRDAEAIEDIAVRPPHRRYARLWLESDYAAAVSLAQKQVNGVGKALYGTISEVYDAAIARDDIETAEIQTFETGLPLQGMQVHAEYTLYAHFFFLRNLLKGVGKIRFFLDQESGIRAACFATFWQEVLEKRCDAFYVRIKKDLTINEKRKLKADSQREMEKMRDEDPILAEFSDYDLRLIVIKERMQELVGIGKWNDRWLFFPFPDMSEPVKAICWLTDLHDRAYDEDHLARLYGKATLHGIDRFFMQARRRLSLLERPISTSSSEGRRWYGYSPYNPGLVGKILDIFRVFYNYVEVGDDKKTPAMRLGLTEKPVLLNEVLA
jgi:transposase-like protein